MSAGETLVAGYPSSDYFSQELYDDILTLPDNTKMDVDWFRKHVWSETHSFEVPKDKLICGMQANIFTVLLNNQDKTEQKNMIGKRVKLSELPEKQNIEMWKSYAASVQHEVEFYREVGRHDEIQHLFPRTYYTSFVPFK